MPNCMDISFNCPGCNQHLAVDAVGAGLTVNCPNCNEQIKIPRGTAPEVLKVPLPTPAPPNPKPERLKYEESTKRLMHMKWEYKVYSWKQPSGVLFRGAGAIPTDEIAAALNKLGNEGWEAVSVFPIAMAEGATNMVGILLKRAVPG
jgi:hypothetical protein